VYVLLYLALSPLISSIILVDPFGSVMFASTVSTRALSVTFALILIRSLMLYVLASLGMVSMTSGIVVSITVKFVFSV